MMIFENLPELKLIPKLKSECIKPNVSLIIKYKLYDDIKSFKLYMRKIGEKESSTRSCFPNLIVLVNCVEILLKYKFLLGRSGVDPENLHL